MDQAVTVALALSVALRLAWLYTCICPCLWSRCWACLCACSQACSKIGVPDFLSVCASTISAAIGVRIASALRLARFCSSHEKP